MEYPKTISICKNKVLTQVTFCDFQGSKQLLDVQGYVIQYEWFMIHIYPQIKADKNELTEINI